MSEESAISRRQAIAILWNQGVLTWKLSPVQKELYSSYLNSSMKTIVWSCSRRLGKSYTLCVIAAEQCLQKPNIVIKFLAPTQKQVRTYIRPLLKEVFKDCPKDLRPDFKGNDNVYRFRNGSEIQLAGADSGNAENLRGGNADLCIVDEAGFCDDLKYIVQSILIPTTTTSRGKIILSSTPPKESDHDFVDYMEEAEAKGNFVKKTIYDGLGSRITMEMVQEIIDELGGADSPSFRREYLCELIQNEETAVVPEFTAATESSIVQPWKRPSHFDGYVAGDIGAKDYTVFLFAYYDFKAGKLIIEDEFVIRGNTVTTEDIANGIKAKERTVFLNPVTREAQPPYLRVCDNNYIVISDLYNLHGLVVQPTKKDDNEAAINNLRIWLKSGRILINPRCQTLINHLKYAKWDKQRKRYRRSSDHGHYDAVDALKYLVRNIQINKNPYPTSFNAGIGDDWWRGNPEQQLNPTANSIKNIFKVKRSIR